MQEKVKVQSKTKKYKTDVKTLSKVFNIMETMDFADIPVFSEEDDILDEFITTLVLTVGKNESQINDFFGAITGESRDFCEDNLDELCEVAQGFFDNIPKRFRSTLKTIINVQKKQRSLALEEMTKSLNETMGNLMRDMKENSLTSETSILD